MNTMKIQKNWTKVALYALAFTTMSSYGVQTEDGKAAVNFSKANAVLILSQDQLMAQFFNCDNQTPYNDIYVSMNNKQTDFINKLNCNTVCGALSKKAHAISQDILTYFGAAIGVIKQYNGRPATDAPKFISDMNKVFSPEQAFTSITTKLTSLLKDAEAANETELIAVIQQLLTVLQKKKAEWGKKKDISLLTGLTIRMRR